VKDFFISYNRADKSWAEWIAWQLEEAGYTTILQAWDFRPGYNFVLEMDKAYKDAERTIIVLSPDFLSSSFTPSEWAVAFKKDPTGEKGQIVPVRVRECELEGLMRSIVYIDLTGMDEDAANKALLGGLIFYRSKPTTPPGFPGLRSVTAEPRFPGALPPIWRVPLIRNPNFTGREVLLGRLHNDLNSNKYAATIAITGLGGVGKTQLALEYACRHSGDYSCVWWMRSEDPKTLELDYVSLAAALYLPEKDSADQTTIIEAVKYWLDRNENWLLIFDGVQEISDVIRYLPLYGSGHVIITSRNPSWGDIANTLSVDVFDRDESVNFILMRTGQDDYNAANALAEELGDLPLALAQAGTYIKERGYTLENYLNMYMAHRTELLERFKPFDYPETVATTWEISFQKVELESQASADLLNLFAFLATNAIPKSLLTKNLVQLPKSLAFSLEDSLRLDEIVYVLLHYGFIVITDDMLAVNRLVQEVTRYRMSMEDRKIWSSAAVNLLKDAFPNASHDVRNWPLCSLLLPHALAAAGHAEDLGVLPEVTASLLGNVALYLHKRAEFSEAKELYEKALAIVENTFGPDHPDVARLANNLGNVLADVGDLEGAKKLYERALRIDEKVYDTDHPNVATDVNNLGTILHDIGDLMGAKKLYERALKIDEAAYGPKHPSVAVRVNNLGSILQDMGDLCGAKKLYERALSINEAAYGPDHPNVAVRVNNLGTILRFQGNLEGAKKCFERALRIDEAAYGPDHPSVARDINNLGRVLQDMGDLESGKRLYERSLAIMEMVYELDHHPEVARSLMNLGSVLQAQGDRGNAEKCFERALRINEGAYGPDHPEVAKTIEAIKKSNFEVRDG